MCVCSESWAGSDCSVPRDSNSLVWETLLDTQMTVVRAQHSENVSICTLFQFYAPAHTNTHSYVLFLHRTRPTGSSTEWVTLWCLDHRATSGCMEGFLCQRAFWEMSTGKAFPDDMDSMKPFWCYNPLSWITAHMVSFWWAYAISITIDFFQFDYTKRLSHLRSQSFKILFRPHFFLEGVSPLFLQVLIMHLAVLNPI